MDYHTFSLTLDALNSKIKKAFKDDNMTEYRRLMEEKEAQFQAFWGIPSYITIKP